MKIHLPTNVIISGSTRSGKTYRTKELLQQQLGSQADYIVVFCPTADVSGDWGETGNRDPEKGKVYIVFEDIDDFLPALKEIVKQQHDLVRTHGAKMKKKVLPQILVIMDDCLGLSLLKLGGFVDKLSTRSRHINLSLFILVQKITAVPRTMRLNSEYLILFSASNFSELERFLQEYMPKRMQKEFASHLEQIFNEPYRFVVCNNFESKLCNRVWIGDPKSGETTRFWDMIKN